MKDAKNLVGDTLSSLPVNDTENRPRGGKDAIAIVARSLSQVEFGEATAQGPALPDVMRFMNTCFPDVHGITPEVSPYFNNRDHLSLTNVILFQGATRCSSKFERRNYHLGHKADQCI